MIITGMIGTGGVGKSSTTSVISIALAIASYKKNGPFIAVMDGDITEGMLTKMFIGEIGDEIPTFDKYLLGMAKVDEIVRTPLISSQLGVRRPVSKMKLKIIPMNSRNGDKVGRLRASYILNKLKTLQDYLEVIGVGAVIVDFPPVFPELSEFIDAMAMWIDSFVAVVTPSGRRIRTTAHAAKTLMAGGKVMLGVILNKFDESSPYDEYGNRWEDVVFSEFNMRPHVIPNDPDLKRLMQYDVIPLEEFRKLPSVMAVINGYKTPSSNEEPIARVLWNFMQKGIEVREVREEKIRQAFRELSEETGVTPIMEPDVTPSIEEPKVEKEPSVPIISTTGDEIEAVVEEVAREPITPKKKGGGLVGLFKKLLGGSRPRPVVPKRERKEAVRIVTIEYPDKTKVEVREDDLVAAMRILGIDEKMLKGRKLNLSKLERKYGPTIVNSLLERLNLSVPSKMETVVKAEKEEVEETDWW